MRLPITPGYSSSNEPCRVDLADLPHLFISYSDELYFTAFTRNLLNQLVTRASLNKIRIAIAVNNYHAGLLGEVIPGEYYFRRFISNEEAEINTDSSQLFMRAITKELRKRMLFSAKQKGVGKFNGDDFFSPLIVFSDNILDLVITGRRKSVGLAFMQLLLMGPHVGIHCVVAGTASYQNLLKQLMQVHPAVKAGLAKTNMEIEVPVNKVLGAELIISGEGLLFFKTSDSLHYNKLYPGLH